MNRLSFLKYGFIAVIAVLFSSCDAIEDAVSFKVNYDTSFTVPATTVVNVPISLNTPDIDTSSSSGFESNNSSKDLIKTLYLSQLDLTITSPDTEDFSFLEQVSVSIASEGLETIEIASASTIDPEATTLSLAVGETDLAPYIKADAFRLEFSTTTDETIASDIDMDVAIAFEVTPEIL